MWVVCLDDMARTFEFVLYFVLRHGDSVTKPEYTNIISFVLYEYEYDIRGLP